MDASHLSTPVSADPVDQFDAALRNERDGVREFLAARQRQLEEAESQLLEYFEQLAREAAGGRHAAEATRQDVDQRTAQLAQEAEHLDQLRADLDARRAEWQRTAEETTRQQESFLETLRQEQQALHQQRTELERRRAECSETDRAERELLEQQLTKAYDEQERLETELAARTAQCDALKQETAAAKAVADELDDLRRERDDLATSLRDAELRLEQAQQLLDNAENRLLTCVGQFANDLADSHGDTEACPDVDQQAARLAREAEHLEQLRADLDARRDEWKSTAEETTRHQELLLETLRQEQHSLEQQRSSLEKQQAALERLQADRAEADRAEWKSLQQQLADAQAERDRLTSELAALHDQCDALKHEVAAAKAAANELDALRHERDALATALREAELRLEQARQQLDNAENRLLTCLGQFADDLAGERRTTEASQDVEEQAARLAREAEHLEQLRADLDARRDEWKSTAEETTRRQEMLLETIRQEQHSLEQQRAALEQQQAALERLQADHNTADCAERELLQQQLAVARGEQTRLESELTALRTHCESLTQEATAPQAATDELSALLREREALATSLRETELRLEKTQQELAESERRASAAAKAAAHEQSPAEADADLQRRYQLVVDDLRELQQENAQLEEQLKEARHARLTAKSAQTHGGTLNWEAEKQRILAMLESECDETSGEDRQRRLEIEEIVERTERIVAEKDAEIAELKQLLDNQSTSVGSLAVGAAALGDMLDKDAIIQEERRNLAQLQEEWREKLRQAEIDMSVERAKLGRQRIEVEEKLRLLEQRGAAAGDASGGTAAAEKPPRNRWLTRLGLKDPEGGSP